MNIRIAYLLIALLLPLFGLAQKVKVKGQLVDEAGENIAYASVALQNLSDSSFQGTVSDDNGSFTLDVDKNIYLLKVSFVGVEPLEKTIDLSSAKKEVDLGVFTLATVVSLNEVVVKTTKSALSIGVDKKVYDVASDVTLRGGNLADVMDNLPSVQVESDGGVTIRGNQNVLILVNGQPSGLAGAAQMYSTIPASTIERVEVITNPSAQYTAQGAAGVINIILKKGQASSFNNNLEVFGGYRPLAGVNGNLAKMAENGSWYANVGVGYSEPKATNDIFLRSPGNIPDVNRTASSRVRRQLYQLINVGGSRNLVSGANVSGYVTYRGAQSDNENITTYSDDLEGALINESERIEAEEETNRFFSGNLIFTQPLGKEGRQLKLGGNVELSSDEEAARINSIQRFPSLNNLAVDLSENTERQYRYAATADFLTTVGNYRLGLGSRGDWTKIDNDFSVTRELDGVSFLIPEFSDNTSYWEDVLAVYGELDRTFGAFTAQAGLRVENTAIRILTEAEQIPKNYTSLFPSASINYSINEGSQLQLSAFRRVNRPQSWMIVPFSTFTDERNIFRGNIDLNPSFVNAVELAYKVNLSDELSFAPTIYYRNTQNEMEFFVEKQQLTIGDEIQDVFVSTMANVGVYETYGAELASNYLPVSWCNLYGELNLNGFNQRGFVNGASFNGDGVLVSARLNVTFNLPGSTKFQIQQYYKGPIETGQYRRIAFYWMNLGLSTAMCKEKATLSFNLRDVFNSNRRVITTFGPDFVREIDIQYRVPQATVSFSYLFNQKSNKGNRGNQFDKIEIVN